MVQTTTNSEKHKRLANEQLMNFIHTSDLPLRVINYLTGNFHFQTSIGRSRGLHWRVLSLLPKRSPILSFLRTFLLKSTHVGGWHPHPQRVTRVTILTN